jgi:hypothetical protein
MAISIFKVIWHYEQGAYGGKPHAQLGWQIAHVGAATGDPGTLAAVLAANGKATPAGYVVVIDSIANEGVGAYLT